MSYNSGLQQHSKHTYISKNCIDNRRQKNDELIVDKHCRYKREINKYCMKTVDLDNIVSV